ncbi:MAG TPA: peroxiredoxin [Ktedonobacterales bacterium]
MAGQAASETNRESGQGAPTDGKRRGQLGVGDRAPDFTLRTQDGATYHLADHLGERAIVLYFYPKDNTRGCTAEACAFRDSYEVFRDAGAEVVGISSDSEASHRGFAERHHLPFTLLSDPRGKVRKRYRVRPSLGLLPGRETFILDRQGIIRHSFSSQLNIQGHIEEALRTLRALHAEAGAEGESHAG